MNNFSHKCCVSDKPITLKIAARIKKKMLVNGNRLQLFLTKQLSGTSMFDPVGLDDVQDFPILSAKKLVRNIFFGSYSLRQCKSYLRDLINNSNVYTVNMKGLKNLVKLEASEDAYYTEDAKYFQERLKQGMKIIAFSIISRHSRNKNYKTFVLYEPNSVGTKGIRAYICNCKSGRRVAGCCIHVATVTYFLGCIKKKERRFPAEHLNSVFINMVNNDIPNDPRLVKVKRRERQPSTTTEESSNEEEDIDSTYIIRKDNELDLTINNSIAEKKASKTKNILNRPKNKKETMEVEHLNNMDNNDSPNKQNLKKAKRRKRKPSTSTEESSSEEEDIVPTKYKKLTNPTQKRRLQNQFQHNQK